MATAVPGGARFAPFHKGDRNFMLAVGVYDLATRRRLHPAWVVASLWVLATEMLGTWLYYQPFWLAWTKALTGH